MIDRFPILGRIIPTLSACIIELFMTPVFNPVAFLCKWQARRGEGGRAINKHLRFTDRGARTAGRARRNSGRADNLAETLGNF